MGLSIKNPEVERLARKIAGAEHISITEAIRRGLMRLVADKNRIPSTDDRQARFEALMKITNRAAKRKKISDLSIDEILGYDEFGIPKQ